MSSIFTRFEIQRAPRIFIALLLWVVFHFLLIVQFNNQYWSDSLPLRFAPVVAAGIVCCCVVDLVLLSLLAGWFKGLRSRSSLIVRAAALVLLLPIYLYFLLVLVSWSVFWLGIGFLDGDMIRAFLVDTAAVWKHFSNLELVLSLLCLALPALLVLAVVVFSPARAAPSHLKRPGLLLLVVGGLIFVLLHLLPMQFGVAEQRAFRTTFGHGLLPNLSLFWSALLPAAQDPVVADFSSELTPIYSLEEYGARVSPSSSRPNIIFIIIEALRSDMVNEIADGKYVMPTLHQLAAAQGTLVENVLAQSAESAYSMTSILTGLYPMKFGVRDTFVNRGYPHTRVYDALSAGGYRTGFFSSANEHWQNMSNLTDSSKLDIFFHSESDPAAAVITATGDDGFPRALESGYLKTGKLDDAVTVRRLLDWLKQVFATDPPKPVFAAVSLQASHFPYQQGHDIPEVFGPSALSDAERRELSFLSYPQPLAAKMKNRYRNSLHYIDGLVKDVVDSLRDSGEAEHTILIVTGDHGELFHEHGLVTHGSTLFNTAMSVPVLMFQKGKRIEIEPRQQRLLDLAPTIVDLAGLPPHDNFQGRSMLQAPTQAPVFSSLEGLSLQDAVVFGGMKLIFNRRAEKFHMFDIAHDPGEQHELPFDDSKAFLCLKKLLDNFRGRQLKYYKSYQLYSKYFPPREDGLPEACL